MTEDQFRNLKPGDEVYTIRRGFYQTNATGSRWIDRGTVSKVNKKTVAVGSTNATAPDLMTIAAGDAAKAEFERATAEEADRRHRFSKAKARISAAAVGPISGSFDGYSSEGVSLSTRSVEVAERIADMLGIGADSLRLRGDLYARLDDDAPTIHLHLSNAQARRVLAVLAEPTEEP